MTTRSKHCIGDATGDQLGEGGASPTRPLIGKAWQRTIREKKSLEGGDGDLFGCPAVPPIDSAELREISHSAASSVILEYEWLGTMGTTQRHYGVFFGGELAGAVCFGYFQGMQGYATYVGDRYAKLGTQLSRGACVHWAHPHSGSKLISWALRQEARKGYKFAIAFSDPDAGEIGTLYQATNWHYLGFTKDTHWDIYHKDGRLFLNDRDLFKKYGFRGAGKIDQWLRDKPHLERRLRKPKGRYTTLMGTRKENKEMMHVLERHIKPYPKRDVL